MRQLIEIQLSSEAQKAASSESFRVGIKNSSGEDAAEIEIYGVIGDSFDQCDSRSVGAFLRANKGKAVNVRLNSPGGLAYDGITIHNALIAHDGPVTCIVDGIAGSAASVIAMGGKTCMYENAQLFIHRASVIAVGNVDMMAEATDWLNKIDDAIARTYKAKTGKAYDKIMSLMKGKVDGTVFTAKEAKEMGFCDEILSLKTGKASNEAPDFRAEGEQRLKSIEASRLERIRTRRELFQGS
jgi:ATP-dependent protease ClpP protease subunit